jgi:N-acetyl-anhydromuramyl-L-alanine amidase AmpD/prefoldin subunit 5
MPRPLNDTTYLYGLHDPGGEHLMTQRGVPGWVLVTVAIGHNPNDYSSGDDLRFRGNYSPLSDQGLGVIVRLNNAYGPHGTLPYAQYYADFAQRCANFVRSSRGCHLWIIGNEPNHPVEWPGADWDWNAVPPRPKSPNTVGEKITPDRYASCYRQARAAIRSVNGHERDQVLVGGIAPWNPLTTYDTNPNGDWVLYFADVLRLIGDGRCDGITLHAYTHGVSPQLVTSDAKVGDPRFSQYHWHFRCYQDFMQAIPAGMRNLPVYITETDQGDDPWNNANSGWVREAYEEINRWNQSGTQQIRSLILYRWPRIDKWYIEGKQGVIEDFQQAVDRRYQWQEVPGIDLEALAAQVETLEANVSALQPDMDEIARLSAEADQLEDTVDALVDQGQAAISTGQQVSALGTSVARLELAVSQAGNVVPPPVMDDLRESLPTHPERRYPLRALDTVRRLVVHHTATRSDISPQQIAQFHVQQGLPGIKYHYLINGDGTVSWVQPLESVVAQTAVVAVNLDGIAVTLAGNFNNTVPGDEQMAQAARLLAYLIALFQLDTEAIYGRSELDDSDPSQSPGRQWLEDARYKDTLVAQVQTLLEEAGYGDAALIAELRRRIQELENQVALLQAQADQVPILQQEIQALRQQVDQLQGEVADLRAERDDLLVEIERLQTIIQNLQGTGLQKPPMLDIVDSLPRHPDLRYESRTGAVRRIVVHHTDTPLTTTVEQIAHYHVWGTRYDSQGNLVKGEWPGIGYHYVILPDGTINWTQRPETRSYHAGNANNDSIGVSLIGRFLRRQWDGTPIPPGQQLPTPGQMTSASQLIAWLMQEHGITDIEQVVGHKEVSSTACPGDQWLTGASWKQTLHRQILEAATGQAKTIELVLLFWDHGYAWAEADFLNAQNYISHFRPAISFTSSDGLVAQHVVIVGGDAGVSGQDEAMLRAAGVDVHRLAGADEAETKAMLDDLVAQDTPWPGAPPRGAEAAAALAFDLGMGKEELAQPDPWTVPDDFQVTEEQAEASAPDVPTTRVKVEVLSPAEGDED